MSTSKIKFFFHTIYYLKPIQVIYRGKRILEKICSQKILWNINQKSDSYNVYLKESIFSMESYSITNNTFTFLNLSYSFKDKIVWNWLGYGKLWSYNLNYFDFIHQENCTKEIGIKLIDDYINQISTVTIGIEPYPLSLRCLNWILFFQKHHIKENKYDTILFQQLKLLTHKCEYHLLGNHLLENGFALLFGSYYFNDNSFYKQAKRILLTELKEQVLEDGAHFELSPMYHCIMLFRILDCYNLVKYNHQFSQELLPIFEKQACKMFGWLRAIIFNNGDIPLFNDAAFNVAPTSASLFDYAIRLDLPYKDTVLGESGYRKFINDKFEAIIDVAKIGPDYQPGHAHADTFNFELHVNNRPIVVDTGTSTYEVNQTRFYERSTPAHNTVTVNHSNSSEVWGGHRVGKRAYVTIIEDSPNKLIATHNGYASIKHLRSFEMKDGKFCINDNIATKAVAYLHFHPSEKIKLENMEIIGTDYSVKFIGADLIELFDSYYAPEFNKRIPTVGVKIYFKNKLKTIFG